MPQFKVKVTGYDNCEWRHTNSSTTIEAKDLEDAKIKANKWCDDNFSIDGYEWYVDSITEIKEEILQNDGSRN